MQEEHAYKGQARQQQERARQVVPSRAQSSQPIRPALLDDMFPQPSHCDSKLLEWTQERLPRVVKIRALDTNPHLISGGEYLALCSTVLMRGSLRARLRELKRASGRSHLI